MVTAVGAGGILASFTDGPSVLYIYPSAGTISMHLPSVVVGSRCSHRLDRHTGPFGALASFLVAVQVHGERREHGNEYP
jgi:hypothetical protein